MIFQFCLCAAEVTIRSDHVTGVCLFYTKAVVSFCREQCRVSLIRSEISGDEEDEGKRWSREGQKEEVFRK